jgi:hypothetical protein
MRLNVFRFVFAALLIRTAPSTVARDAWENTGWYPSRYTNVWIVAQCLQIFNARAEVESPQTRPLNATG